MQAGWLESPVGPLFACWHPPAPGAPGRACAVLLCDPFGSDRMNLHLTYRALAQRLAEAGFPCLRVDLPGTCDSSGHPDETGQVARWQEGLQAAADWLRRASGADELCAFGALLGGTLALWLAQARADVRGLCLWGAFPAGRAFLREVSAFQMLTKANRIGRRPTSHREGDQEAMGFLISRATAEQLSALDLYRLEGPLVARAALFRRNRAAPVEPLLGTLRRCGAEVHLQPAAVVDLAEIEDTRAQPPEPLLAEVLAWFRSSYPPVAPREPGPAPLATRVELTSRRGEPLQEEVVRFGPDERLFGVLSEPPPAAPRARLGVVLVNGGSNHRVGINRNYVDWGREWAGRGFTVLRFDVRGLGDSPPERPEELGVLYRDATRQDVHDALDFLERRLELRRFVGLGLCAGGYQAFHAALGDPRLTGLVMLNPLRFQRLDPQGGARRGETDFRSLATYARTALDPHTWVRVALGRVNVRGITRSVGARLLARGRARVLERLSRLQGGYAPPASWLAGALLSLTARGCHVQLVFDAGDEIVHVFAEQTAQDRARLDATGRFASEILADTDHILTPLWSQEYVGQLVERRLLAWEAQA